MWLTTWMWIRGVCLWGMWAGLVFRGNWRWKWRWGGGGGGCKECIGLRLGLKGMGMDRARGGYIVREVLELMEFAGIVRDCRFEPFSHALGTPVMSAFIRITHRLNIGGAVLFQA